MPKQKQRVEPPERAAIAALQLAEAHHEAMCLLALALLFGRAAGILAAYRALLAAELALLNHSDDAADRMVADSLAHLLAELDRDIAGHVCGHLN